MTSSILSIEHLAKQHPDRERNYLFSRVSVRIQQPESIALLGVSGQGKSTLLRIIGLLERQDEGTIRLHGRSSEHWKPQEWRTKACYVAQQPVMLPGTVEDNLRTVSKLHRRPFDADLAKRLMAQAALNDMDWGKKASELSGGEKQRVALVRSLLLKPDLLLLDEITASLDVHSKQAVEQMLSEWCIREGAAMIWVTHDLQQARHVCSRVWFLGEGTLLEDRPAASFFERPDSGAARRFLNVPEEEGESASCPH